MADLELKPKRVIPRPNCPFFGFYHHGQFFINQDNNHCALQREPHRPYMMSVCGFAPNWNECQNNTDNFGPQIHRMRRDCVVLADEFLGDDAEEDTFISFAQWFDYIMNQGYLDALLLDTQP